MSAGLVTLNLRLKVQSRALSVLCGLKVSRLSWDESGKRVHVIVYPALHELANNAAVLEAVCFEPDRAKILKAISSRTFEQLHAATSAALEAF